MRLPRVYPIADVGSLARRGWDVGEFALELVRSGAEIVQLRDKEGSPQQILKHAETVAAALRGTDCLAVMNDRADLAVLAGWRAVHLGHKDLSPEAARRLFGGQAATLGVSTHNEEQVMAAEESSADYVAIGPVFGTASKADAEPVVGLEGVRRARALTHKPLVAIGGITRDNAHAVLEAGADSVAVIGELLTDAEKPGDVLRDFLRRLR